jgi:hypothetical protein
MHALVNVDLRGGQTNARCRVHGLEQVVYEFADRLVDHRHGRRPGTEPGVGKFKNSELRHV